MRLAGLLSCGPPVVLLIGLLASVQPARADSLIYDFSGGLPAELTVNIDASLTGSVAAVDGHALFNTISGAGFARMVSGPIAGDFTAHAVTQRIALSPTGILGMALYYDWPAANSPSYAALYCSGDGTIRSTVSADGGHAVSAQNATYPMTVDFVMERAGNTIFTRYNDGLTVRELNFSSMLLSAPVHIGLFLADYGGNSQGEFNLLTVEGYAAYAAYAPVLEVPEPGLRWLVLGALISIGAAAASRYIVMLRSIQF